MAGPYEKFQEAFEVFQAILRKEIHDELQILKQDILLSISQPQIVVVPTAAQRKEPQQEQYEESYNQYSGRTLLLCSYCRHSFEDYSNFWCPRCGRIERFIFRDYADKYTIIIQEIRESLDNIGITDPTIREAALNIQIGGWITTPATEIFGDDPETEEDEDSETEPEEEEDEDIEPTPLEIVSNNLFYPLATMLRDFQENLLKELRSKPPAQAAVTDAQIEAKLKQFQEKLLSDMQGILASMEKKRGNNPQQLPPPEDPAFKF